MTALALPVPGIRNPYLLTAWLALRQHLHARSQLIARAVLYLIFLFIYSRIWGALLGSAPERIWYLALSEWITLSQPRLHLEIERDVRSGNVACALTRPSSYLGVKLAEAAGELALNLLLLLPVGALGALAFAGELPRDPRGLLPALSLALLASVFGVLCSALIGLCAFWLRDIAPLAWVWQKAGFLLGGLWVPLELYPRWLRVLALWSPFSALINGPARTLCAFDPLVAVLFAIKLVSMLVLVHALLEFVYQRALRRLAQTGE